MPVDILSSVGQLFQPQAFDSKTDNFSGQSDLLSDKKSSGQTGGGSINFGSSQPGSSSLNFGNMPQSNFASKATDSTSDGQNANGDLSQQLPQLLNELIKLLMQLLQQNGGNGDSSNKAASTGNGSPQSSTDSPPSYQQATANPPSYQDATGNTAGDPATSGNPPTYQEATGNPPTYQQATENPPTYQQATSGQDGTGTAASSGANAGTGVSTQSVGSGPRSFDITNSQDHDITLGMFDKNNQQVASMTLKPGETGTMNYQNDFTGVIKQADSDGKFQDSASRLEFYNGFINTSDIDGRNASISATDNNGFKIGDNKSIADNAPSNIVSQDSAGNKTIAGWYDGSTEKMKAGGAYMVGELGTGDTYMHPADDQLGQGNNPMRHTDAMKVYVNFGKA